MPVILTPAAPSTNTVPKAELYTYYGQKPRRKQLGNDDYSWWNNGAKPHELKFTAAFLDPLTGEVFFSGRFGDPKCYQTEKAINNEGKEVEVVWFTTKKLAEHGAAARCYDCLRYREALQQGSHAVQALARLGSDTPYTGEQAPGMPPVPPAVAEKLFNNKNKARDFLAGM
jgi:hypothetical protein